MAGAGFVVETTRPLFFHRMLLEENAAYRWLYDRRYGMVWRRALSGLFDGRDGHMLMVIAHKPAG